MLEAEMEAHATVLQQQAIGVAQTGPDTYAGCFVQTETGCAVRSQRQTPHAHVFITIIIKLAACPPLVLLGGAADGAGGGGGPGPSGLGPQGVGGAAAVLVQPRL